jgi:hypothetical protein
MPFNLAGPFLKKHGINSETGRRRRRIRRRKRFVAPRPGTTLSHMVKRAKNAPDWVVRAIFYRPFSAMSKRGQKTPFYIIVHHFFSLPGPEIDNSPSLSPIIYPKSQS